MVDASFLAFHISVLAASLLIIILSGNYFVDALSNYAKKIGMSKYFIGMVVVAVATSSPDIATSIMGLASGHAEIMSGVVMGGLMLDLAFLNGWFAVLSKRIRLDTSVIKGIEFAVLGLMLLPYAFMLDGEISRVEGIVMVLSFVVYIAMLWKREKGLGHLRKRIPFKEIGRDWAVFLLALGAMLLAARYAVFSSLFLSVAWGIPVYLLSITVLALAAALPDAIAGTIAIIKKKGGEIGFGENIGTTLLEVNLFTGIVAIVKPMRFGVSSTIVGAVALMISSVYFMMILRRGSITRRQGFVFLGIYGAYIIVEIGRVLTQG